MEVKPENYFWLKDGRALKNLQELSDALENMSDDIFNHHVNTEKNDFANWIRDIIDNKKLSDKIAVCKSKLEMYQAIKKKFAKKKEKPSVQEIKERDKDVEEIIERKTKPTVKHVIKKVVKHIKVVNKAAINKISLKKNLSKIFKMSVNKATKKERKIANLYFFAYIPPLLAYVKVISSKAIFYSSII